MKAASFTLGLVLGVLVTAALCSFLCLMASGCTATQRAKARTVELQLARDCRDVEDATTPPEWIKLACDVEETTVLITVPSSDWAKALKVTVTEAGES